MSKVEVLLGRSEVDELDEARGEMSRAVLVRLLVLDYIALPESERREVLDRALFVTGK